MTGGDTVTFSGLDGALVASFLISYSLLALVQISNLFNRNFMLFSVLLVASAFATFSLKGMEFPELCEDRSSTILCNNGGDAVSEFTIVWVYVSITMLLFFSLARMLQKIVNHSD